MDAEDASVGRPTRAWRSFVASSYPRMVFFGFLFGLVVGGANVYWNFVTTLLPGNLGFIALAITWTALSVTSLFSVLVIEALGFRFSMVFSCCCLTFALTSCWIGRPWLILAQSPILGLGFAVLYNTQSSYCARLTDKKNAGRILAVFWTIAVFLQASANFLVGILSKRSIPLRTIFLGTIVYMAAPTLLALALPKIPQKTGVPSPTSTPPIAADVHGEGEVPSTPPSGCLKAKKKIVDRLKRGKSMLGLLKRHDMRLLIPWMLTIGTFSSFYGSRLNPVMGAADAGMAWMLTLFGRCALTYPIGFMSDFVDHRIIVAMSLACFLGMNTCIYFFESVRKTWLYMLAFSFFAAADPLHWSGVLNPTLSRYFDDVEGAFALYRTSWPMGQLITLVVSPYLDVRVLAIAHSVISTISLGCLGVFCHERIRKSKAPVEGAVPLSTISTDDSASFKETTSPPTTNTANDSAIVSTPTTIEETKN